jgi:hypothetical protein
VEILIGLVFLGASLAVAFVLPVLSFLRATRATQSAEALSLEVQSLRRDVEALREAAASTARVAPDSVGARVPAPVTDPAREAWAAQVRDMAARRVPPTVPAAAGADAALPPMPEPVPAPAGTPATASVHPAAAPIPDQPLPSGYVDDDRGYPVPAPGETPPLAEAVYTPAVATAAADGPGAASPESMTAATDRIEGLEERIGARWLLYAGIGSLILGLSYFIKFAFDNGWVSEPLRVAIGVLAGTALIVIGQRFARRGLAFFGHALSGGGLVVLYVAIFAALHAYALIEPPTAFAAMLGVTVLGTWLADRHRVQVLGALALLGGFLTPALVGGREDRQIVLFLYNALLLAGALAMVVRHAWAGVAVLGYVLAIFSAMAWAAAHYRPGMGLRTLLLLTVHLVLVAGMIVSLRRQRDRTVLAMPVSWLLLSAPVFYHLAALWLIGRSQGQFLVYLLVATVAGLSVSYHAGWRWTRTIVLALVALPFIDWLGNLATPRWYTGAVVTASALYLLHLAGQWRDLSDDDPQQPVPIAEFVHTHATGLFLPVALYVFFEDRSAWWNAPMLTVLAGWNLAIAAVVRVRMAVLSWHFLALAVTIGAVAVSEWFEGPVVAIGWALEGAALGYAGLQARNRWLDRGALVLFAMSALRLVESLVTPLAVGTWPVVNARALATAAVIGAMTWLAIRAREAPDHLGGELVEHVLIIVANILAIAWISAEIVHVFGERAYASSAAGLPAGAARAELGQQVALSVAWALYAVGLVAAGFRRGYAPARYLAIALFGLTIVKVMTKDIAELDRVYQMLSVLALGVLLVAASYLYQRMTTRPKDTAAPF